MNTQSNAVPEFPLDSQAIAPGVMSATRPMYWSVRRELWENRSIYIAPLAAAGIAMLGFLISLIYLPRDVRGLPALPPAQQRIELAVPYAHVDMLLTLTAFLVAIFYSLDALYGERRDRSILFWKSLPVSDRTTVLSKAIIPLVVLPPIVFVITVAVQFIMLLLSVAVLAVSGVGTAAPWTPPLLQMQLVSLYGLVVMALWHAPLYMWMLLVSGWVRCAPFLWATLPLLVIGGFEWIAFHTSYFGQLIKERLIGFAAAAFDLKDKAVVPVDPHFIPLTQLAPGRFLSNPSLWIGLVFAAACLVAAVRLRRYREPI